ncbi:tRNA glutamyl-Q(34) synthetase GluQRS [Zhongshania aliphaticivorans]|uniref:tRNA glutamyl-Q(34) synthetase GluQRS n=1 Tax=Zhongshania aliphaticivorans TaxID=1470434 RepID=UPI0012E4A4D9|nr:tRNA glutamyl-Q(34) synthetase GluQRS [Zhongshania aliphaticivorans]CAA0113535.1 Glutamyl-Q tRNA(Asp) synthetase [Zhongshania aliphaticivorans]
MSVSNTGYIGRFAPSPSGPLHLGSLLTAVASYLDARATHGQWLLRIEDIDPPREQEGAVNLIINSLIAHGLQWDGDILWQSQRSDSYDAALDRLLNKQRAYYCSCSRAQLANTGGIHPECCFQAFTLGDAAIRLKIEQHSVEFLDRVQGPQCYQSTQIGDPVLKRRDGLYAYQLAVVVDDAEQQITDIVRGVDLLDATAWQLHLQQTLSLKPIRYLHLPVIVGDDGHKLSKQSFAPAINDQTAKANLLQVLRYLGQALPPADLNITELLRWATQHWQADHIPNQTALSL